MDGDADLKVGDVVRLASGGASMTVVRDNGDGTFAVHWFGQTTDLQRECYQRDCLVLIHRVTQ